MSETNPHHTTSDHRARLRSAIETAPFRYGILALIGLNAIILGLETSQTVMAAIGPALVLTDRIILAIFVGFEIITKVPPTLHTPLMSGSNAISGIAIVGAIISTKIDGDIGTWLGLIAVVFATVNCVGGFMVTDRMLKMFKRK